MLGWRDVFGNRFCHENCAVLSMARKGEPVHGFEVVMAGAPKQEPALNVTVLRIPASRPESASRSSTSCSRSNARAGSSARWSGWARARAAADPRAPRARSGVRPPRGPIALAKAPPLTEREREILRWLAEGLQNKEIARELGISLATVRNHVHNMLEKLDVHSKLEAVSLAFRQGWVSARSGEPTRATERVGA